MLPSDTAPRVLFVDNQVSDFLHYRLGLANTLRKSGFDVHIAVPQEPGIEDLVRHGFSVHTFYLRRKSIQPLAELRCWISLFQLYRRLRPTLVHHICLKPTLYGGIAARLARIPAAINVLTGFGYLFNSRSMKTWVLRWIVGHCLRFAFRHENHRVILQNPDDLNFLVKTGLVSKDQVVLIKGSGVDLSSFTIAVEPDGPPLVVMASRLLWTKGVGEFVEAARVLRAGGTRARFLLFGEPDLGHPAAVPLTEVKKWSDAGDVEWRGWSYDMPRVIAQSHIVCLPSFYGEGIPRILIEAASSGRPIVTTDSAGCREVVRQGQNGFLVPAHDTDSLIMALAKLIEDASLRRAMGARSREIAAMEFSVEQVIKESLAVYFALLPLPSMIRDRCHNSGLDISRISRA